METSEVELFKQHLEKNTKLMDSSILVYTSAVNMFVRLNPEHLDEIEYYNDFLLQHAVKKRNYLYYEALKKFIRFHVEDKVVKTKMVKLLLKPPEQQQPYRKRRYLSVEERKRVISWIESLKHRLIARIQLYTGCRSREILTLKKDDIRNEPYQVSPTKSISVMQLMITGKGNKIAPIWIHDKELADDIDSFTQSGVGLDYEYYFLDRKYSKTLIAAIGTNYHWYWADLKRSLLNCGYKMEDWATHDFRRNSAVDVWDMDKDMLEVSRFLRHQRLETTVKYLSNAGLQNKDLTAKLEKKYNNQ